MCASTHQYGSASRPVQEDRICTGLGHDCDCSEAVGKIGVSREVFSGCVLVSGSYSRHVCGMAYSTGLNEISKNIIPRVVDVGIDLVCSKIPVFCSEPNPDIPANLANPHRLLL